ncbi:MAG: tetratricopeptide repeat protein [Bryobacteraceae bacterium]
MNTIVAFCRYRGQILVFVALVLIRGANAQTAPPWLTRFQDGMARLQAGDLNTATAGFESLWKSNPGDAQLATSIGGALDSTSHHDEATVWYERALALQPDFEPALKNLAMNDAIRGNLNDSAALLGKVIRNNPENAEALYNLGLISLRLRQYSEAGDAFRKALQASNSPVLAPRIRLGEATALFHLRRYGSAVDLLISSGGPTDSAGLVLLGSAQALSGKLPASVRTLQDAAARSPNDPQVYFRLALIFSEGRRDQEAQAVLTTGLKQIPNSPLLQYGQAVLNEIAAKDEEAIRWAEQSLNGDNKQPEVWGLLGTLFDRRRRTDDGLRAYREALRLGAGAYTGAKYAELLVRLQIYGEAESELLRLDRRFPHDERVNRAFGKLYRARGNFSRAEVYLRRAVRLDPSDPQAHYVLAQVLQHLGNGDEASKELRSFKDTKEKSERIRLLEVVDSGL